MRWRLPFAALLWLALSAQSWQPNPAFLLPVPTSNIAFTNVGTPATGLDSPNTNVTITVGVGGVPSASLIVVCAGVQDSAANAGSQATLTDTANNTYHQVNSAWSANGSSVAQSIWYAYNATTLSNTNTIKLAWGSTSTGAGGGAALSAFYATNIKTASDPIDSATFHATTGTSATPSAQLAAAPTVAGSMVLGVVTAIRGPTFTQDSTHAAYQNFPVRASSGTGAGDAAVAGGSVVSSSQLTYAPALGTSRAWVEQVVAFKPP